MFRRFTEQDFYQILEIDYSATPEEIQTAYENAREIYARDSLVSSSILNAEERNEILRRVKEAYNTLIAEDSRRGHYMKSRHESFSIQSKRFFPIVSIQTSSLKARANSREMVSIASMS